MQKTVTLLLFISVFIFGCTYDNEEEKYKGVAGCETGVPEFELDVKPIIDQYCVPCHGPNIAQSNVRLDSELNVLTVAESGLLEEVLLLPSGNSRRMPQAGDLPPCDLEMLIEWINNLNS